VKELYIMRGLPGSGKSTLARFLAQGSPVLSADDFFVTKFEGYRFIPSLIGDAHAACQSRCENLLKAGAPLVLIDNTNTQLWEFAPYLRLAEQYGYTVIFVEPETVWAKSPEECFKRGTHGVPLETIRKMAARWEEVTVPE
jgi:predicted kinase